jgi:hypothetical protein
MIAHVAEASENSGRVVLLLAGSAPASAVSLPAALHVASSFNAGLESLFVEDPQLIDFATFRFARDVAWNGANTSPVTVSALEAALERQAATQHGEVVISAEAAGVPVHCRTLRGDTASALASACSENGPWNVAVLSEAIVSSTQTHILDLFGRIQDVTGFVVAGPAASRATGPVVAVVEQLSQVQPMLRAAQRLADRSKEDVHLVLFGGDSDALAWMDGQVRLILGAKAAPDLILTPDTAASPAALAAVLNALGAGFVIAQLGGDALPVEGGLAAFSATHDGPLFLIR